MRLAALGLLALAGLVAGCAGRYVATPEEALRRNDLDWSIEAEPPSAPEPSRR